MFRVLGMGTPTGVFATMNRFFEIDPIQIEQVPSSTHIEMRAVTKIHWKDEEAEQRLIDWIATHCVAVRTSEGIVIMVSK